MGSLRSDARAIGRCANKTILWLQQMLLGSSSGSAAARATLASFRHGSGHPSWMQVGGTLLSELPALELTETAEARMLKALCTAVELYAWHQQSRETSMALQPDEEGGRREFGRSCRLIEPNLEDAAGVRRRLMAIESSSDFEGIRQNLRALIRLMRVGNVQVDYGLLARDLYLIQFEGTKGDIFMRWSRAYYGYRDDSANQEEE